MSTLKFKFLGIVNPKGKLIFNPGYEQLWNMHMARFIGRELEITAGPKTRPNSRKQQKYFYKVIVGELAKHLGYSLDEMERELDEKFFRYEDARGTMYTRSKAIGEWTTVEFEDKMQEIREWAYTELNVQIPLPGEIEY